LPDFRPPAAPLSWSPFLRLDGERRPLMETMKAPLAAFAVALPLTLTALAAEAMFDLRDLFWAF